MLSSRFIAHYPNLSTIVSPNANASQCSLSLDIKILYVDNRYTMEERDMWDAGQYLRFGGERARPFFDLVAQVGATSPRYVADLGCGPGNLTAALAQRW